MDETTDSKDANALIQEYNFTPSNNICNYFQNNDFELLYKSIYYVDVFCVDLVCNKLDIINKYKPTLLIEITIQKNLLELIKIISMYLLNTLIFNNYKYQNYEKNYFTTYCCRLF